MPRRRGTRSRSRDEKAVGFRTLSTFCIIPCTGTNGTVGIVACFGERARTIYSAERAAACRGVLNYEWRVRESANMTSRSANAGNGVYRGPRVVILDMDGVLAIGEPFAAHLARLGTVTLDQSGVFFGGPFQQCLVGRADLKRGLAPYLAAWGWPGSVDEFMAAWFAHEHVINEPLVARIRQSCERTALPATSPPTRSVTVRTTFVSRWGLGTPATAFGPLSWAAPSMIRLFFARLLSRLRERMDLRDLRPREALFWDDSAANVAGARSAGLRAEQYTSLADFDGTMRAYGL